MALGPIDLCNPCDVIIVIMWCIRWMHIPSWDHCMGTTHACAHHNDASHGQHASHEPTSLIDTSHGHMTWAHHGAGGLKRQVHVAYPCGTCPCGCPCGVPICCSCVMCPCDVSVMLGCERAHLCPCVSATCVHYHQPTHCRTTTLRWFACCCSMELQRIDPVMTAQHHLTWLHRCVISTEDVCCLPRLHCCPIMVSVSGWSCCVHSECQCVCSLSPWKSEVLAPHKQRLNEAS